ncbi:cytochrome P450 [Streptomyces sp. NBC_01803]|uniref:cytochrome P450 n=1 Tax=Streptomyces sp. NBC_01803 TaxID=2975946 RepID=UPI002DD8E645|nr:cytochrome P450 [Streptomyces sp. NBC_01803]WSA43087.1 cytochrome P450 [Streptomyces sp. NBC_01803]
MTSTPPDTAPASAGPPPVVGDGADLFAWLRETRRTDPVWIDPASGACHVLTHADALRVLSEPAVFSSDFSALAPPPEPGLPNFAEASLSVTDPPFHGRLRKLVSQAFTPRTVAGLEPRIAEVTRELLDAAAGREQLDLVDHLAGPLPVVVIAELLGIPTSDREMFRRWAEYLLPPSGDVTAGQFVEGGYAKTRAAELNEMADYLLSHVRDRRARSRDDLLSRLVAAEVDGERLTDKQTVNFAAFMLLAGHLTTTLLLSNALLCFEETPGSLSLLREDPSAVPTALEEVLRHRPPVVFLYRLTREDTRIGAVDVPAGRIVVTWIVSANRDERQFPDADRFDPRRTPNAHLTFSHGIHFCLGAPLARMESSIVLRALLDRYRDIACGEPEYHQRPDIFGVTRLPVTVRAA